MMVLLDAPGMVWLLPRWTRHIVTMLWRLSVMLPLVMLVALAATATWASVIELAGAAGTAGEGAGVPVTTARLQVSESLSVSVTLATTMSMRALVGSEAAMARLTVASL